jgi:5-formyltetrahydrofolate cyclo-ligase
VLNPGGTTKVAATELPLVDLGVCGSVAVNREGARIGKGGGFSDLEVAFLVEAGVIRSDTVPATTVHPRDDSRLPGGPDRDSLRGHLVRRAA